MTKRNIANLLQLNYDNANYNFSKYVDLPRWNSYYHQIDEVAKCKWKTVLLIWVWDWIVVDTLKKMWKEVTTFDFDEDLSPDIVGDVTKIDEIVNKKYDIVVCCQVLEHIPFEVFEPTIKKISNIVNERFILSLPNKNIWIKFWFFCPIIRNIILKYHFRFFYQNTWDINKEWFWYHYWEVDAKPDWKKKNVDKILRKYFSISDCFSPFNNTYHIFRSLNH